MTTEYRIRCSFPEQAGQKAKFVFFTDLHSCCSPDEKEKILARLESASPAFVLCGGDSIVARPGESVREAAGFLAETAKRWPLYIASGNHEYRARIYPETYGSMYEEYRSIVAGAGAVLLENESVRIEAGGIPFRICGYDMPAEYYSRWKKTVIPADALQSVFGPPGREALTVLMAHHPKMIPAAFAWGADLTLCGHFHGGVMRLAGNRSLLSPDLRFFPGNAYGRFQSGAKHAIISSGCGDHSVPVRIRNPREIVLVTVCAAE